MKLKPYPKYKDSGIQWIGKIPEGWEVNKLKYNYEIIGKTDIPASEGNEEGNFPFFTSGESIKYIDNPVINGEYIIVGDGGIPNFKYYKGYFSYSDHCFLLKTNKKTSTKFLYYFLIGNIETLDILCFHGMGLRNLDKYKFNSFFSSLCSLSDQTAIASFLDKKTTEIDTLIENDKNLIALLKEKRTALINRAVTKGLDPNVKLKDSGIDWVGEIPEGWEVRKVKQFSKIVTGSTPNSGNDKYWEGDINWVTPTDLSLRNKYIYDSKRKITKEGYMSCGTTFVKEGTIIMATRAPIGYPSIVKEKLCFNQGCKAFEIKKDFMSDYCYYYFNAYEEVLNSKGNATTFSELSTYDLASFPVLKPSKKEQLQIVNFLDKATSKIDKTIKLIEQKNNLLEEYKKSLIYYVITGKVDVRRVET